MDRNETFISSKIIKELPQLIQEYSHNPERPYGIYIHEVGYNLLGVRLQSSATGYTTLLLDRQGRMVHKVYG